MGYIYGYHRVSSKEQHLDRGIAEIKEYCKTHNLELKNIYTDKITGKNFDRPRYTVLKEDVLRAGDVLIVTELDRLGRNKADTMKEIQYCKDNNIRLMVLELPTTLMDVSIMNNDMARMMLETINNMMLELYASMAQAEMEKRIKRQKEGIQAKKDRGEWSNYGRPRAMDFNVFIKEYEAVEKGELTPYALMIQMDMSKSTFYRYKKMYENRKKLIKKEE